jgi:hypothetical protein
MNMMINDQAWGVFHLWNIVFLESKRFCKLEGLSGLEEGCGDFTAMAYG